MSTAVDKLIDEIKRLRDTGADANWVAAANHAIYHIRAAMPEILTQYTAWLLLEDESSNRVKTRVVAYLAKSDPPAEDTE